MPFTRAFNPELFPTRTRVSAMAISQNVGTNDHGPAPGAFRQAVAPPGSTNIPLTIGAITFAITIIAAVAAWSARETYRIHIKDLGQPGAVPVDKGDYDRLRAASIAGAPLARHEIALVDDMLMMTSVYLILLNGPWP